MRVSVLEEDPGYRSDAFAFQPWLDGVELRDCVTADEELGEAVINERGADGKLLIIRGPSGERQISQKTLKGKVELRRPGFKA